MATMATMATMANGALIHLVPIQFRPASGGLGGPANRRRGPGEPGRPDLRFPLWSEAQVVGDLEAIVSDR